MTSNSATPSGNGVVGNDVTGNGATPTVQVSTDVNRVATLDPATGKPIEADEGNEASPGNDESHLPKRWRGKSDTERAESFKTLESELGRKNNELGQLRYAIDQMLQLKRNEAVNAAGDVTTKKTKAEPVTGERLLNDPDATIASVAERVVGESNSGVQERLDRLEFDRKREKFATKFPKYEETMVDDGFKEWVQGSPLRQRLATEAATKGSFEAAEELFGLYDESVVRVKEARVAGNDPNAAAANASLVKPGNGNTTGGAAKKTVTNAGANKKVYVRSELALLYNTDRDAYNAQMPDVMRAYREGRVR